MASTKWLVKGSMTTALSGHGSFGAGARRASGLNPFRHVRRRRSVGPLQFEHRAAAGGRALTERATHAVVTSPPKCGATKGEPHLGGLDKNGSMRHSDRPPAATPNASPNWSAEIRDMNTYRFNK
ncbi:hypothetical protein ACEPT7_14160 [Burkholderia ubonensis]|uniref:hypothetical protein n=1 Tax=Burkholderia ubonensis TaxID=101571 RepID=UPI00358F1020